MRYFLYNLRTRKAIYFCSRSDMNKWIRSHFCLMSYRQMCTWTVHRDSGRASLAVSDRTFVPFGITFISHLSEYILSHLKIKD